MGQREMASERMAVLVILSTQLACLNLGGDCADEVTGEVRSPGGRWIATSYVRDCGATTAYATHVILRDAKEPFRPWRHGGPADQGLVCVEEQRPTVSLARQGPNELTIRITGQGGRTFTHEGSWRGVGIVYVQ